MEFIGYTALIDAIIVIVSWVVLFMRKGKMQPTSEKAKYLSSYFLWTFIFLVIVAYAIFQTSTPEQMGIALLIADLVLWVSMVVFILMMYAGTQGKQKGMWIGIFLVFAAMRTLWQVAQLQGIDTSGLGTFMNEQVLGKLDQWLMYAVWVPSAVVLITVGLGSDNALVRMRSVMFAVGLLLISFTWAFRFLGAGSVSQETAYVLVGGASVAGFVLLLMGLFYKGSGGQMTQSSNM